MWWRRPTPPLQQHATGEVKFAIAAAVFWNLMGFSSFVFILPAIFIPCLIEYFNVVKADGPYNSQKFNNYLQRITPKLLFIIAALAMRLLRWALQAIQRINWEVLSKIDSHILTTLVALYVYWTPLDQQDQVSFNTHLRSICAELLSGHILVACRIFCSLALLLIVKLSASFLELLSWIIVECGLASKTSSEFLSRARRWAYIRWNFCGNAGSANP
jgi:uncharacterized membrane protein YozB (DUF420 family)